LNNFVFQQDSALVHLAFNTVNAGVNAGGDTPRKVQFSAIFETLEAP